MQGQVYFQPACPCLPTASVMGNPRVDDIQPLRFSLSLHFLMAGVHTFTLAPDLESLGREKEKNWGHGKSHTGILQKRVFSEMSPIIFKRSEG